MKKLLPIILICVLSLTAGSGLAGELEVSGITASAAKKEQGNTWVNLSADVTNNSDSPRVLIILEAVDKSGSTMKIKHLTGTIPTGTTSTLTDSISVSDYEYAKIASWIIAR